MVNKKNFEQELELELEMELEREEILKKFAIDKEEDEEGITDKLSQSAVKSLVESFDKDVLELTETQVMADDSFEDLDEDFKNELEEKFDEDYNEEEDTVLVYNTNANILELDDMNDITDMKVLTDESLDEIQGAKPSKGNKIKKYYMVAVFSILVGFTFVVILLILYTRQQNALPSDDNVVADTSNEFNYDSDYVNKLINQNQELFKEVGDLRKEVARLSTSSSANTIEEPQQPIDTGQSVVELPPLEEIEKAQQPVEEAQPVVQVQKPPAEQVSKKPQKYTVQKGDTLFSISRKFYGSIHDYKKISSANDLKDSDSIKFGDVLIIP